MNFKQSLRASDQVVLTSRVIRVGKSSMDIEVLVDRQTDDKSVQRGTIARALLTFVSLDRLGKPAIVPGLTLETDEEKYLFAESNLRLRIKKRLERFVESRNLLRLKNLSKIKFSKKTISEIVNVLGS